MRRWRALIVLGTAQFLMVLDTSVMNVSISQLVEDFDTEVTTIQAVITLYALVMAAFMIIGGRLGDILGRRRLFFLGLVVYAVGSALTALAPTVWVLALGWSVIEGLGAAMVLPAMAALVAESYRGPDRAVAYGVIGGLMRRGDRGRAAARRLGDHLPHLAAGVRRRGRRRPGRAVLPPDDHRTGPHRDPPPPRRDRRRAVGRRAGAGRARGAPEQHLGLGLAPQPALHRPRVLPDAVRRRGRSGRPRPLRPLGATAGRTGHRSPRPSAPAGPWRCAPV